MRHWPEPVERVGAFLRAAGVEARIEEFRQGTPTAEASAEAVGCGLDQIVKSVVCICDDRPVLVLVPGDRRVDTLKVARAAAAESARVGRADEVVEATGFQPGAVAPFPLRHSSTVIVDRTVLRHPLVWVGAGSPKHLAALAPADLVRISGALTADVSAG